MTEEKNIECANDCENCDAICVDDDSVFELLVDTCSEMELKEFAPMMGGIVHIYADVHGISVGKVLDAMFLNAYYDDDPHWDEEHPEGEIFTS